MTDLEFWNIYLFNIDVFSSHVLPGHCLSDRIHCARCKRQLQNRVDSQEITKPIVSLNAISWAHLLGLTVLSYTSMSADCRRFCYNVWIGHFLAKSRNCSYGHTLMHRGIILGLSAKGRSDWRLTSQTPLVVKVLDFQIIVCLMRSIVHTATSNCSIVLIARRLTNQLSSYMQFHGRFFWNIRM
jgi:hypothetical protein